MPGRLWHPLSTHQHHDRGRSSDPKCRFPKLPRAQPVRKGGYEERMFKPEWFAGNMDIEDDEERDSNQDGDGCLCGVDIENRTVDNNSEHLDEEVQAYPAYLRIHGPGRILVKGSTCQTIIQLHEQGLQPSKIAGRTADICYAEGYTPADIRAIIRSCTALHLTGQSPLATADWENEPIEGWWFKEESYCEALRRQEPVNRDICGYECDDGWWKDKQHKGNRDWLRFGERSIGSHNNRRRMS